MLAVCGDLAGAADAYRGLLDQPLLSGPDAGRYVQLMVAAGRVDEAVAVLEQHTADGEPFVGDLLLALASAHAARDDLDATRQVLARVRAHWSAALPQVSVQADVMEASVAAADGDDERAAQLFRSLTDTDDAERRDLARPLLIAAGALRRSREAVSHPPRTAVAGVPVRGRSARYRGMGRHQSGAPGHRGRPSR